MAYIMVMLLQKGTAKSGTDTIKDSIKCEYPCKQPYNRVIRQGLPLQELQNPCTVIRGFIISGMAVAFVNVEFHRRAVLL